MWTESHATQNLKNCLLGSYGSIRDEVSFWFICSYSQVVVMILEGDVNFILVYFIYTILFKILYTICQTYERYNFTVLCNSYPDPRSTFINIFTSCLGPLTAQLRVPHRSMDKTFGLKKNKITCIKPKPGF